MTPEIERLRAEWDASRETLKRAKADEANAMERLDDAITVWASGDLKSRQIIIGETEVECGTHYSYANKTHYMRPGAAVVEVKGRGGKAIYRVHALTKTGSLSKAAGAYDRWFDVVRKVGEA